MPPAAEQIAKLELRFACGHRRADWDNSYGDCIACGFKRDAEILDALPEERDAEIDLAEQLATVTRERDAALTASSPHSQRSPPMPSETPMTRAEIKRLMNTMELLEEQTGGLEPTREQWRWAAKCCAAALIQATEPPDAE